MTESRVVLRGRFTGRERRFNGSTAPVATIDGQQSPEIENRGTMVVRLILSLMRWIWVLAL